MTTFHFPIKSTLQIELSLSPSALNLGFYYIGQPPFSFSLSCSWSVILAESEMMVSPIRQWLARETHFSGSARRMLASVGEPYAFCHLLWGWRGRGHMLKKSWVLLGGPQPGIPLSPECFGSWLLKVWPLDQPCHHYRGTCQKCRILGLPSASESESAFEPDPKWFQTHWSLRSPAPADRTWDLESEGQAWVIYYFLYYVTLDKALRLSENWPLYLPSGVIIKTPRICSTWLQRSSKRIM